MDVNTIETIIKPPSELVELPFLIFIYISDAEQQVSVNEVNKFNKSITNTDWCKSSLLKEALILLESNYADLWKIYSTKNHHELLPERIKQAINSLKTLDDAEYHLICRDLIALGKSIAKASNKLAIIPTKKKTALVNVENFLSNKTTQDVPINQHNVINENISLEDLWPLATLGAENSNFWGRGKIQLICNKIINETHDVKTFCFISADKPVMFSYKPGQFISLELFIDGKKVIRSYSISSSPSRSFYVSVTVKRVHNGLVSNWLHDNLKVGDKINANGPFGKFNCFDNPAEKMLLISGGSGITPMMSILRWVCDTGSRADIIFLHNAQTPKDLIFLDELKLLSKQNYNVKLALCVSNPNDIEWDGHLGRISSQSLNNIAPDINQRAIFVCGPAPYMDAVHHIVQGMGFNMENYFSESFGSPISDTKQKKISSNQDTSHVIGDEVIKKIPEKSVPQKASIPNESKVTINFKQQNKKIDCDADDSILDAAENDGIDIPYSCRSGTCGTCKVLKLSGDIDMDTHSGLSDDELEQGYVLACVAKPKGLVEIDF